MLGQTTAVDGARRTAVRDRPPPRNRSARVLLDAVAEKTGYPAEMLELDMRLDDDLGIDSIKRVEILSAVQDRLPETRSIGPEQTATLRTLGEIVEFLAARERPVPTARERTDRVGSPVSTEQASHDEPRVVLRRLEPRAVPLASPERREAREARRRAETIWITDDGSPLTEAVRSQLSRRGFRPRVVVPVTVPVFRQRAKVSAA